MSHSNWRKLGRFANSNLKLAQHVLVITPCVGFLYCSSVCVALCPPSTDRTITRGIIILDDGDNDSRRRRRPPITIAVAIAVEYYLIRTTNSEEEQSTLHHNR